MTRCSGIRSRSGARSSALWGKGASSIFATIVAAIALAAPATASAAPDQPVALQDDFSFYLEVEDEYVTATVSWDE